MYEKPVLYDAKTETESLSKLVFSLDKEFPPKTLTAERVFASSTKCERALVNCY